MKVYAKMTSVEKCFCVFSEVVSLSSFLKRIGFGWINPTLIERLEQFSEAQMYFCLRFSSIPSGNNPAIILSPCSIIRLSALFACSQVENASVGLLSGVGEKLLSASESFQ